MNGPDNSSRHWWLAIVLLPLLALVYCSWSALSCVPVRLSSGDALTDAFIEAELKQNLQPRIDPIHVPYWSMGRLSLDDEQFAAWESKFGNDPRFWMLKYYFNNHRLTEAEVDGMLTPDRWREGLLDQAIARGAIDGAVLHMKLRERQSDWLEEAGKACTMDPPKPKTDSTMYQRELRRIVDQQYREEQEQLFASFLNVAPDEFQPHFMLACIKAVRGDYEGTIAEFELANRAEANSALLGFPYDWLMDELGRGNPSLDRSFAGGMYSDSISRLALPNFIRIKQAFRTAVAQAAERGDVKGLTVLHRAACRFGREEGAPELQVLVGIVLVNLVKDGLAGSSAIKLSPRQSQVCGEVSSRVSKIKVAFKKSIGSGSIPAVNAVQAVAQGPLLQRVQDILSGGQCTALHVSLEMEKDGVAVRKSISGEIAAMFRELEAISYEE